MQIQYFGVVEVDKFFNIEALLTSWKWWRFGHCMLNKTAAWGAQNRPTSIWKRANRAHSEAKRVH